MICKGSDVYNIVRTNCRNPADKQTLFYTRTGGQAVVALVRTALEHARQLDASNDQKQALFYGTKVEKDGVYLFRADPVPSKMDFVLKRVSLGWLYNGEEDLFSYRVEPVSHYMYNDPAIAEELDGQEECQLAQSVIETDDITPAPLVEPKEPTDDFHNELVKMWKERRLLKRKQQ